MKMTVKQRQALQRRYLTINLCFDGYYYEGTPAELLASGLFDDDPLPAGFEWKRREIERDNPQPGRWSAVFYNGGGEFCVVVMYSPEERAEYRAAVEAEGRRTHPKWYAGPSGLDWLREVQGRIESFLAQQPGSYLH